MTGEKAVAFERTLNPVRIRAAIRDEVASILPLDELEEIHRSDALAWIDSGAPLCRTLKSRIDNSGFRLSRALEAKHRRGGTWTPIWTHCHASN